MSTPCNSPRQGSPRTPLTEKSRVVVADTKARSIAVVVVTYEDGRDGLVIEDIRKSPGAKPYQLRVPAFAVDALCRAMQATAGRPEASSTKWGTFEQGAYVRKQPVARTR